MKLLPQVFSFGILLGLVSFAGAAPPRVLHTYSGMRLPGDARSSRELTRRNGQTQQWARIVPRFGESLEPRIQGYESGEIRIRADWDASDAQGAYPPASRSFGPDAWQPGPTPDLGLAPQEVVVERSPHWVLIRRARDSKAGRQGFELRTWDGAHRALIPPGRSQDLTKVQVLRSGDENYLAFLDPRGNGPEPSLARLRIADLSPFRPTPVNQAPGRAPRVKSFDLAPPEDGSRLHLVQFERFGEGVWIQIGEGRRIFSVDLAGNRGPEISVPELPERPSQVLWMIRDRRNWAAVEAPSDPKARAHLVWSTQSTDLAPYAREAVSFPAGLRVYDLSFAEQSLVVSLWDPRQPNPTGELQVLDLSSGKTIASWRSDFPRRIQSLNRRLFLQDGPDGVELIRVPIPPDADFFRNWKSPDFFQTFMTFVFGVGFLLALAGVAVGGLIAWGLFGLVRDLIFPSPADPEAPSPRPPGRGSNSPPAPAPVEGITILEAREPIGDLEPLPETAQEILGTFLLLYQAEKLRQAGTLSSPEFEALSEVARERMLSLWRALRPDFEAAHRDWILSRLESLGEGLHPKVREHLQSLPPPLELKAGFRPGPLEQLSRLHTLYREIRQAVEERGLPRAELDPIRARLFEQALDVLRGFRREGRLSPALGTGIDTQLEVWLHRLLAGHELDPDCRKALLDAARMKIGEEIGLPDIHCRVCGDLLQAGVLVACQNCETPHHGDCWEYNQGCAVFACGETQARKIATEEASSPPLGPDPDDRRA